MEKNPEYITRKYLRDIILNFLITGKDTTAGTLSWFIYVLCKYPLVQEKVAQEVKNAIEVDEDISFIQYYANLLTDEVINKMQYLHAALAETLRLYPAVPMDSKVCFSNDTLPDGFDTTKGDVITYLPYAMGRMKYLWGEDAENFRPERLHKYVTCEGLQVVAYVVFSILWKVRQLVLPHVGFYYAVIYMEIDFAVGKAHLHLFINCLQQPATDKLNG